MGHGGEEFILETVAVGQFLVQRFELASGLLEDARALFLHRVDAVGQRQRQQAHFQRRADLAGVHGEKDVGQVAQHHQRVDDAADEKGGPGEDEVTRHAHTAQPGKHPGSEDHHGEQQGQVGGQTQCRGITDAQCQDHHHGAAGHHQQQQAIDPGAVFTGVQEAAGELAAEQGGRANQKWRRGIGPPGVVGPEILDTGTVDRDLIQAERGDIKDVIEVAGVAHAEEDEQVVHQHHQQHAVDDAKHVDTRGLLFQIGVGRPQGQRRLDRTLTFQAQIDALALVRLEVQLEQVIVLADLAGDERQRITSTLSQGEAASLVREVEFKVIERRVSQLQQPVAVPLRLARQIVQVQPQPEYRARIAGVEHGFVMQTETALHGGRGDVVDAGIAAHVLEHVHALPQRQSAHMFVEGNGAHERGKNEAHDEQEQPVHTTPKPCQTTPRPPLAHQMAPSRTADLYSNRSTLGTVGSLFQIQTAV